MHSAAAPHVDFRLNFKCDPHPNCDQKFWLYMYSFKILQSCTYTTISFPSCMCTAYIRDIYICALRMQTA